jgi:hypothetical protein
VTGLRAFGAPYWLGRSLLELGVLLVKLRRDDEAVPLLHEACDLFADLDAKPLVDRARSVLRDTVPARPLDLPLPSTPDQARALGILPGSEVLPG